MDFFCNALEKRVYLKIKIAQKIFIINRYILLILSEGRENIENLSCLLNKNQFYIKLISKIDCSYDNPKTQYLKKILNEIMAIEKNIIDKLIIRREEVTERIKFLKRTGDALKAYKSQQIIFKTEKKLNVD